MSPLAPPLHTPLARSLGAGSPAPISPPPNLGTGRLGGVEDESAPPVLGQDMTQGQAGSVGQRLEQDKGPLMPHSLLAAHWGPPSPCPPSVANFRETVETMAWEAADRHIADGDQLVRGSGRSGTLCLMALNAGSQFLT